MIWPFKRKQAPRRMLRRSTIASTVLASKSMKAWIGSGMPASRSGGTARRTDFRSALSLHILSCVAANGIMSSMFIRGLLRDRHEPPTLSLFGYGPP
jgi:hypothetical protein